MAATGTAGFLKRRGAHVLLALPLAWLVWRWGLLLTGTAPRAAGLTAEPVSQTINELGLWALRALCLTLLVTPLRKALRWSWLAAWRRPLGLWCFAFACLHLLVYFGLDQLGDPALLIEDVAKHRFILLGMAAWLLLLPLALTSTSGMIRRLGARRWQRLHRLILPAALLAACHFILRVKGFQPEPWIYAVVLSGLVVIRLRAALSRGKTASKSETE
ncbi:MAG TPA: protein-methionine-sulfoxide reductase heme-binding subunit MsrQ [Novosphingobium sp.]